ncbi:hypothetical protein P7K49_015239 [Saguinus oedipus]|uniref:Uncharacterized protein n=1 Tax=Saguinus oedipus TaxID=9490 RepID=A0ABQ9V8P7_SAGOE|nr:hypothetical protein P7K49_015239 [Saguinus oedipus]
MSQEGRCLLHDLGQVSFPPGKPEALNRRVQAEPCSQEGEALLSLVSLTPSPAVMFLSTFSSHTHPGPSPMHFCWACLAFLLGVQPPDGSQLLPVSLATALLWALGL